MAVSSMERIYLFFRPGARTELLNSLREAGALEISEVPESESREMVSSLAQPDRSAYQKTREIEERISVLRRLTEYLKPPEQFPSPKVSEGRVGKLAGEVDSGKILEIVQELEKRESEIDSLDAGLEKISDMLREFPFLDAPLSELGVGSLVRSIILRLSPSMRAGFSGELDQLGGLSSLLFETRREAVVFAAWPLSSDIEAMSVVENRGAVEVKLPSYRTGVLESLARVEKIIEKNRRRRKKVEERKKDLRRFLPSLFAQLDLALAEKAMLEAGDKTVVSSRAALVSGWVRRRDRDRLLEELEKKFPETAFFYRGPSRGEDVPVALENGPVSRSFEAVGDLYGRTSYQGTDASRYLALFFALGFGFCLADVGYGLTITLASVFLLRKFRSDTAQKMLRVFFFSGIATVMAGIITNSWLGNFSRVFPFVPDSLARVQSRLALASPADTPEDTMLFFYFALLFGYLQTTFGVFLRLRHSLSRAGARGALESAPALVFQLGIPLLAFSYLLKDRLPALSSATTPLMALIGLAAALIIRHQFQVNRDIIEKLFWSAYSIYTLVVGNLVSDILSYARIFALGLTSALLAVTVNELALMAGAVPIVGFLAALLVLAGGHAFNLFISGLSSYVHTSRLQYLEFFNKFYEGGGRPFNPLRKEYRYLELETSV